MEEESRRFLDELASGVRMDNGRFSLINHQHIRQEATNPVMQIAGSGIAALLAALVDRALDRD